MDKYIERMCDESREISAQIEVIVERIDKLKDFMETSAAYQHLDVEAQKLMRYQRAVMADTRDDLEAYQRVVEKRIAHALTISTQD